MDARHVRAKCSSKPSWRARAWPWRASPPGAGSTCAAGPLAAGAKRTHVPKGGGAFERADEARVPIEEVILPAPVLHLPGIQEVTPRVGVPGTLEAEWDLEDLASESGFLTDVLEGSRGLRGHRAVDVDLGQRTKRPDLVAVRLQQGLIAKGRAEPGELAQHPGVARDQVV